MKLKSSVLTAIKKLFCSQQNSRHTEPLPTGGKNTSTEKESEHQTVEIIPTTNKKNINSNDAYAGALEALHQIWCDSGSLSYKLAPETEMWHCGTIESFDDINSSRIIWFTKERDKKLFYARSAILDAPHVGDGKKPFCLHVKTTCELEMADFNCQSLSNFTIEHCDSSHAKCKVVLGIWFKKHKFDGCVRTNKDDSEVVLANPKEVISIIEITQLS